MIAGRVRKIGRSLASGLFLAGACRLVAIDAAWVEAHAGPLETLFAALDRQESHVGAALEAWETGDRLEASRRLAAAYRQRPDPLPGLTPTLTPLPGGAERARAFLAGRYAPTGQPVELARAPDGGIDWEQRGPNGDKEFAWMLNRHRFIPSLVATGQASGDPAFAAAADAVLRDWILAHPYPDRLTFSPAWRALEVARRLLDSWGPSFHAFAAGEVLSDETLLLLLSSIPAHADALHEHASVWGGNHLLTEKIALVLAGHLWPEFRDAGMWRRDGLDAITRETLAQTYPDGAYTELSNHYQRVVCVNLQWLADLLALAGEPVPTVLAERLAAMWFYFGAVMKPDGTGPLNNAADREFNATHLDRHHPATLRALEHAAPVQLFPWAGHAVLRDDWSRTSHWAFFDAGPRGTAHHHDDAMHLSVSLAGDPFLVDAGRYLYRPGPWRRYFAGREAHNTLSLAGHRPRPRPGRARAPTELLLAQAVGGTAVLGEQWFEPVAPFDGRNWRHRRLVLHLPAEGFVVVDELTGFGAAEVTARWHFAPGLARETIQLLFAPAPGAVPLATRWFHGSNDPIAGWHSPQYGERQPAWQRDDTARVAGPARLVWRIGPLPGVRLEDTAKGLEVHTSEGIWQLDAVAPAAAFLPRPDRPGGP
ncbi:MAG: alginate lyase family protein [Opitutales bacterium]